MAWLKRENVDEGVVKVIEYRYLNARGYPINETLAKKCKVTEYDADGNIIRETMTLCIPWTKYHRWLYWGLLIFMLINVLVLKFVPNPWPIFRYIRYYLSDLFILILCSDGIYALYRKIVYKELYMILWGKNKHFIYMCYPGMLGKLLFDLTGCIEVAYFSLGCSLFIFLYYTWIKYKKYLWI